MAVVTAAQKPADPTPAILCPNCGSYCPVAAGQSADDSQRRIAELEAQVKILTLKATEAADKLADYEDKLHAPPNGRPSTADAGQPLVTPTQSLFGSFLTSRMGSPSPSRHSSNPSDSQVASRRESDLQQALAKEQERRQKAEGKVDEMSGELEDLSAQLFQQANEMVATERKARARLEERVEVLEKRDVEKRKRLERLEGALKRIDRVKELIG